MKNSYECYVNLVKAMLNNITAVTSREQPGVKVDDEVDVINTQIDFMREKNVQKTIQKHAKWTS